MEIDFDEFLICFPAWIIGTADPGLKGILDSDRVSGERAIVVFTDRDLAQRFFDSTPMPDVFGLREIDPFQLLGIAVVFEKRGYTHAVFDPGTVSVHTFPIGRLQQKIIEGLV